MISSEKQFNNILKEIRLYESAPSYEGMQRMGLIYHKNFGVSLINLKKIAEKYKVNHQLAELLRTKNFRETLILSFIIEDKDKLTISETKKLLN